MTAHVAYELLLIGGGAGVGKTTVAWETSAALQRTGTAHCLIEGDYMDQIHPAPDATLTARRSRSGTPRRSGRTVPLLVKAT
jgi:adenylylsulfate kinase-like enzyme